MKRLERVVLLAAILAETSLAAPADTIAVTSDGAQVDAGGTIVPVGAGRWFGVLARKGDLVEVPICVGTELRRGWIPARQVRTLTDRDVDLVDKALGIAKIRNPGLDVAASRARFDELAARAAAEAKGARALAAFLFEREGFATGEPDTLDSVLEQKKGNCLGLSILYLGLAQRLGQQAWLVTAPRHVFVQGQEGPDRVYLEMTRKGEAHDSVAYLKSHLGEQQFGEAGGIHFEALSMAQAVGVLYEELGRTLRDLKRYAEGFRYYALAAEINPRHAEAYVGLGATLTGLGELDAACGHLARAAELNPRDPEACCYWGVALRRLGRHNEACAKYARAVELRPRYDKALCNWGVALERMGQYAQACARYAQATAINPRNQDAWYNWGVSVANLKEYGQACEKFARAVELAPSDPSAHFYWGVALHQLGQNEAACGKFARSVELAPRFAPAYRAWAAALARMGKEDEAREKLERAAELELQPTPGKGTER